MIISVDVTKLVYQEAYNYIPRIPELHTVLEKCGATVLGWYFVEGGGHGEVVCITKWEGIQARAKGFEEAMRDLGFTKLQQEVMKCVSLIENFICIPNPAVSIENWSPSRRLTLRMYKVNVPQAEAAKKYVDLHHYFKDKIGVASSLIALLHPVAFQGPIGLISITEEGPSGIDAGLQKILKAAADPDHASTKTSAGFIKNSAGSILRIREYKVRISVREMNKSFEVVSSRLMSPHNQALVEEFLAKKE